MKKKFSIFLIIIYLQTLIPLYGTEGFLFVRYTAPVVDNKDSAIITNTLVKAHEAKTQAQQALWKQQLQQMLPEMRNNKLPAYAHDCLMSSTLKNTQSLEWGSQLHKRDKLYLRLGKYEIILANPDQQLGKDQDGNLVMTGYLVCVV